MGSKRMGSGLDLKRMGSGLDLCLSGNNGVKLNYEPTEWPNLWLKCERAPRASC
jgi:hypothetical protein